MKKDRYTAITEFEVISPTNDIETVGEKLELSMFGEYCPDASLRGYSLLFLLDHPSHYRVSKVIIQGVSYVIPKDREKDIVSTNLYYKDYLDFNKMPYVVKSEETEKEHKEWHTWNASMEKIKQSKIKKIKYKVKKKKVEYWVAFDPDGNEFRIKGIDQDKLIDGMELEGEIQSNETQDRYADGSFARSVSVDTYLLVDNQKK